MWCERGVSVVQVWCEKRGFVFRRPLTLSKNVCALTIPRGNVTERDTYDGIRLSDGVQNNEFRIRALRMGSGPY